MIICAVEEVSCGCFKLTTSEGPSFFIRKCYLDIVPIEKITSMIFYGLSTKMDCVDFSETESDDIEMASMAFLAEKCALGYIGRAEHSRFLLSRKLEQKGFSGVEATKALDYLEQCGMVSDERYARAFLHSRKAKNEGRTRLSAELNARGVRGEALKNALDDFFGENDEIEICKKACKKISAHCTDENKLYARLFRMGFSAKDIRLSLASLKNDSTI